jgi:hypothetical protein
LLALGGLWPCVRALVNAAVTIVAARIVSILFSVMGRSPSLELAIYEQKGQPWSRQAGVAAEHLHTTNNYSFSPR